jgi:hypothetical protein
MRAVAPAMTWHRDRVVCVVFMSQNDNYVLLCEDNMDCH